MERVVKIVIYSGVDGDGKDKYFVYVDDYDTGNREVFPINIRSRAVCTRILSFIREQIEDKISIIK